MSGQLDLTGSPALTPPEVQLRPRQRLALEYIAAHGPVASDEIGAVLHEDRRARGLKGHASDERCDYCTQEGAQMGAALRLKGLVVRKRGAGWIVPGADKPNALGKPSAQQDDDVDWGGF